MIVGPESALFEDEVFADDAKLPGAESLAEPIRVQAKLRYRMPAADGWLSQLPGGELHLKLDQPQRAVTPGQALVCYVGDEVIAGGTIREGTRVRDGAREVSARSDRNTPSDASARPGRPA